MTRGYKKNKFIEHFVFYHFSLCYIFSSLTILKSDSPFKNDEKCSLFHLKSSFRSQDIQFFFKNKVKFQNLYHILVDKQWEYTYCPISHEIKANQTFKFGQVIKYNKRNIFLRKSCGKWGRETSSRPLFVFQKRFISGKSKWSAA